jgi:hypothetical protein
MCHDREVEGAPSLQSLERHPAVPSDESGYPHLTGAGLTTKVICVWNDIVCAFSLVDDLDFLWRCNHATDEISARYGKLNDPLTKRAGHFKV